MDDAKVLQACRLLHEALCDDLELRRLLVQVDRDRVSLYDSFEAWQPGKQSDHWRRLCAQQPPSAWRAAIAPLVEAFQADGFAGLIDFKAKTAPYKIDKPSHRCGRS